MGSLLDSAWQAVLHSRVIGTLVSVIPWPVRRSVADVLLVDAPRSRSSGSSSGSSSSPNPGSGPSSSNPGPSGATAGSGHGGSGSAEPFLDTRVPLWIRDGFKNLWLGSGDVTEQRHGIPILTCCPPDHSRGVTMVRKENLELWDFLKDAHVGKHRGGLVITGQPGTGKTRSLRDVLARALKERIPVAFCDQPGEYYFCDGTGCRRYSTEEYVLHDVEPGKFFLALVDSHATLVSPPQNFIDQSQRCYTVQAASPHPRRWRDWAKERGDVQYWVWPFWSETEVCNLQHYYEQERRCPWKDDNEHYYSPVELFKLLGPSARLCFPWAGTRKGSKDPMDDFVPYLQPNDVFEKVDDFITAMKTGVVTSPRQGLNFHRLFVTSKPFGVSNPMPYGPRFHHAIATDAISKRLLHHFNQRTIEERVSLLSKFASYPVLMGLLYEPLVLQFLTTLETPISYHLVNGLTMTLGPGLRLASLQFDPDTSIEPHPNDIHVPPINFPSLDAFIIIIDKGRTEILLLQMTVATTHKVVLKGVAAVVNVLRRSMKDFSVKFIFVTPGPSGEKMARKLQKIKIRGRSPIVIDVGWMETGQLLQCDDDVLRALVRCDGDNVELECEDDDSDTEPPAKRARTAS